MLVGGKLEAGALVPGSRVMVVPGYETTTVKSLEVNGQVGVIARAGGVVIVTTSIKRYCLQ